MIPSGVTLAELERDALTEIVNIGVSRAASNLRKMIGGEVLLSVPSIEVVSQRRAARLISEPIFITVPCDSRRCGSAMRVSVASAVTFTSHWRRNSSGGLALKAVGSGSPALFTSTSMRP